MNKANLDPSKLAAQNALNSSTDVRTVSLNHQDATDKDSIGKIDSSPSLLLQKGSSSEDSRPVKVKSRWRRSSELEMGESAFSSFYGNEKFQLSSSKSYIYNAQNFYFATNSMNSNDSCCSMTDIQCTQINRNKNVSSYKYSCARDVFCC